MFDKLFVPGSAAALARHSEINTELCAVAFAVFIVTAGIAGLMWFSAGSAEQLRRKSHAYMLFTRFVYVSAVSVVVWAVLAVLDVAFGHGPQTLDYATAQDSYYGLLVPVTIRYILLLVAAVLLLVGRKRRQLVIEGQHTDQMVPVERRYMLAAAGTLLILVFVI